MVFSYLLFSLDSGGMMCFVVSSPDKISILQGLAYILCANARIEDFIAQIGRPCIQEQEMISVIFRFMVIISIIRLN